MKRILNDADSTSCETKKRVKEPACFFPILSLCVAAAKAVVSANKSTPFGRAIHIPKSPIADPGLLVRLYEVLTYYTDFDKTCKPALPHLANEFPLTRHRRVLAVIHGHWRLTHSLDAGHGCGYTVSSSVLCEELRKWISPKEFDYLLIHTTITTMWGTDTQELLLQTPAIFARHLETMQRPSPLAFEVNMLIATAHRYITEYHDLAESVVYPNIRSIFCRLAILTPERLRFDLVWIFNTVTLLPLIQAVWPLINLCECPTPMLISWLKQVPLETLNWIIEHMPRAAKQQFLAQQRAQMWMDPALRDAL